MRLVEYAQAAIREVLQPDGFAIDATAGNGHDTRFLAETVGTNGQVLAFDVQYAAICATRDYLHRLGLLQQTRLIHSGHESMASFINGARGQPLSAVMFNLGYLPGSDRRIVTQESTTLAALLSAVHHLAPGGRITLIGYCGHPGGTAETDACQQLAQSMEHCTVRIHSPEHTSRLPPRLIMIEKKRGIPGIRA